MSNYSTYHCLDKAKITKDTPKLAFYISLIEKMFHGVDSQKLFEEYCTPDFWYEDPEFHIISPSTGGKVHGVKAIDIRSCYYRGDGLSFRNIATDTKWVIESEDRLVRCHTWAAWDPFGEYTGFKEGDRVDEKVTMEMLEIIEFRDGKICSIKNYADLLIYHYDMAGHDLVKAVQPFIDAADFWNGQKENMLKGLPAREDPGLVFGPMPE